MTVVALNDSNDFIAQCERKRDSLRQAGRVKQATRMSYVPSQALPPDWRWASLAEVCERVSVGHVGPTTEFFQNEPMSPLLIRSQNVRPGFLDFDDCATITPEFHEKCKKSQLRSGDILIVRVGANRGDVAILPETYRPTNCANVIFARPLFSGSFFAYYLQSEVGQKSLISLTTGSAQGVLNTEDVARLPVPVPPQHVQDRISSILGAYDDLIGVNRRRIALLEEMARRLFDEWFVRFRFPGYEVLAMVETPSGPLPEGWRREELCALCKEIRDTVSPADVEVETPYVGLEHIPRRSTTLNAWGRADEVTSTKLRFRAGDVLFGKIRPYFHKVVFAPFEGVSSSDAIVIRSRTPELMGLVLSVTSSDDFVAQAVASSNGTKMPRANWNVLSRTSIPIGPDEIMSMFSKTVASWVELSASLNRANMRLSAARNLLLPRYLSGELTVLATEPALEAVA
jgi:type I restriction enzyme S subunit